jgi:hypothetical protein
MLSHLPAYELMRPRRATGTGLTDDNLNKALSALSLALHHLIPLLLESMSGRESERESFVVGTKVVIDFGSDEGSERARWGGKSGGFRERLAARVRKREVNQSEKSSRSFGCL